MRLRDVLEEFKNKPLREVVGAQELVNTVNKFLDDAHHVTIDSPFDEFTTSINRLSYEQRELILSIHVADVQDKPYYNEVVFLLGATLAILAFIMSILLATSGPTATTENTESIVNTLVSVLEMLSQ